MVKDDHDGSEWTVAAGTVHLLPPALAASYTGPECPSEQEGRKTLQWFLQEWT